MEDPGRTAEKRQRTHQSDLCSTVGFPSLNVESLIAYVDLLGSAGIAAKVGWVFSMDPDLWRATAEELDALRSPVGKGPYFLDTRTRSTRLVPEWNLYVPGDLDPAEEL